MAEATPEQVRKPEYVVVVRWLDARGTTPEWESVAGVTERGEGPCEIVSVGWQIPSGHPECIAIAPHWTVEDDPDACGIMYIPKSAVVQMTALALPHAALPEEGEDG